MTKQVYILCTAAHVKQIVALLRQQVKEGTSYTSHWPSTSTLPMSREILSVRYYWK